MNLRVTLFLAAFPIGLMGLVQFGFSVLSEFIFADHEQGQFLLPAGMMTIASLLLITTAKYIDIKRIGYRDALLFASMTWVMMGLLGAIPIIEITGVSITDGVFESVSALTTTGATILNGLDTMPKSFLLYRQFLQWLGGIGMVIFVVAVLPMLNVGGMKLLKAETPGPIKDDKLSPRVANATRYLLSVYLVITSLCALSYYLAGMSGFDAIAHSLSTVSTGGFSTHDASLGFFHSPAILIVSSVFMLMGAISFALHFRVYRSWNINSYWQDEETRSFIRIIAVLSVIVLAGLLAARLFSDQHQAMLQSLFHVISFITSTGFVATSVNEWPLPLITLLIFAGYLGGCAGSTAGGNKIIRDIVAVKIMLREFHQLIFPRAVFTIKYMGKRIEQSVLSATIAFMTITTLFTVLLSLLLVASGLDVWSSFTAVAACVNVLGPAFGELGNNFQAVNDFGTWVLSFAMILGRLEYFTVLALLIPSFWKH